MNIQLFYRNAVWPLVVAAICALGISSSASALAPDDAQIIKDFQSRIDAYMDVHKKQTVASKSTDSAEKLAEDRKQSAMKMQAARSGAKQGDIFTPQIAAYFQRQIATTLKGTDGVKVQASLVLYDVTADLIVDLISNAVPAS